MRTVTKIKQNNGTHRIYTCTAVDHLTMFNKERNKEIHDTCKQRIHFKPRASCVGCEYLEME